METIELEAVKKIELEILSYIDRICKENDLRYFLCGGTLLGAVRHKGFIPWDDDIDISMPRSDYDRFIELCEENDMYSVLTPDQEDYYYNFAKVVDRRTVLVEFGYKPISNMGIYIDIFPLEGMPDDETERKKHFAQLDKLRKRINSFAVGKPRFRKNLMAYAKSVCTYIKNKNTSLGKLQNDYERLARKYDYSASEYVYATGGAYQQKDIFSKELFLNDVDLEFEGRVFSAPAQWDKYLKQLYGDYMQLPPIEKRVSHHNCQAKYK